MKQSAATIKNKKRVATLRELAGKHPVWYIAEQMGSTIAAINQLAAINKISLAFLHRFWDEEEIATLLQMRSEGHKFSGIAVELRRSEMVCANKYRSLTAEDRKCIAR